MDSTALALTLAGFGVLLIALSYQRHLHRRTVAALAHGIAGAVLFLAGALLFAVALNFNTYDKLSENQPLAELSIEQSGPQTYQVRLMRIPAGDLQVFTLKGDRWQLQARLLQWHGWAQWLGLSTNVRLEQLLSTFDTPPKAKNGASASNTSYRLSRNPGINLWNLQQQHPEQIQALTAQELQTENFALRGSTRFHVYLSAGVLTARVINQPKVVKPIGTPTISYRGVDRAAVEAASDAANATDSDEAEETNKLPANNRAK
ncbi:MAG: hypothetical protein QM808_05380 [Steroidobacteraceae bacterium]